jgi:hypothetical protein
VPGDETDAVKLAAEGPGLTTLDEFKNLEAVLDREPVVSAMTS